MRGGNDNTTFREAAPASKRLQRLSGERSCWTYAPRRESFTGPGGAVEVQRAATQSAREWANGWKLGGIDRRRGRSAGGLAGRIQFAAASGPANPGQVEDVQARRIGAGSMSGAGRDATEDSPFCTTRSTSEETGGRFR